MDKLLRPKGYLGEDYRPFPEDLECLDLLSVGPSSSACDHRGDLVAVPEVNPDGPKRWRLPVQEFDEPVGNLPAVDFLIAQTAIDHHLYLLYNDADAQVFALKIWD